ncbi:unnamed protein product [Oikopleura dioica]|uniref:Uncharacterized protein n=1 Tax=Oikopleura dioica TaxID=34765 RepID=E4WPT7_OIKDI|nr:unnamed protein product [Oikopleura dioica]
MYRLKGKFLPRMMDKFLYDRLIPFQDAFRFESMPNKLTGSTEQVFEFTEKLKDKIEIASGRKVDSRTIAIGNNLTPSDLRKIAHKGAVIKHFSVSIQQAISIK